MGGVDIVVMVFFGMNGVLRADCGVAEWYRGSLRGWVRGCVRGCIRRKVREWVRGWVRG